MCEGMKDVELVAALEPERLRREMVEPIAWIEALSRSVFDLFASVIGDVMEFASFRLFRFIADMAA